MKVSGEQAIKLETENWISEMEKVYLTPHLSYMVYFTPQLWNRLFYPP